jgi:hypothetical protein
MLENKIEEALRSLCEQVPCCSCCSSDTGYKDAVSDAAKILGYTVTWQWGRGTLSLDGGVSRLVERWRQDQSVHFPNTPGQESVVSAENPVVTPETISDNSPT